MVDRRPISVKSLNVPPAYFFEGAPAFDASAPDAFGQSVAAESGSAYVVDFISTMEGLQLNRAFARIKDTKVRKRVVDLVVALAGDDEFPDPALNEAPV